MEESGIEFLNNVRIDVCRELGCDAAILLAYLGFVSRVRPKDAAGFFTLDSSFASKALGIDRWKLKRDREKLVNHGLIEYVGGANQNVKPRYKVACGKLVEN